jgi:hypothetical protein
MPFGYIKQRTRRLHNNINNWRIKSIEDCAAAIPMIRKSNHTNKDPGGALLRRQDLQGLLS